MKDAILGCEWAELWPGAWELGSVPVLRPFLRSLVPCFPLSPPVKLGAVPGGPFPLPTWGGS